MKQNRKNKVEKQNRDCLFEKKKMKKMKKWGGGVFILLVIYVLTSWPFSKLPKMGQQNKQNKIDKTKIKIKILSINQSWRTHQHHHQQQHIPIPHPQPQLQPLIQQQRIRQR